MERPVSSPTRSSREALRAFSPERVFEALTTGTMAANASGLSELPVSEEEHDRVNAEHRHGIVFRILTGFPPRYFVRLDSL